MNRGLLKRSLMLMSKKILDSHGSWQRATFFVDPVIALCGLIGEKLYGLLT